MDEIGCDWMGPSDNWPQRACVNAGWGDDVTLIEITAIAAQLEG